MTNNKITNWPKRVATRERRRREVEREKEREWGIEGVGNTVCVLASVGHPPCLDEMAKSGKMLENCRQREKGRKERESKSHNNKMRINHKCH